MRFRDLCIKKPRRKARDPPVTTYVVLSGFLSSELGEPDKDNLFGLQKTFRRAFGKCLLYYITCSYPLGGVVINVLA